MQKCRIVKHGWILPYTSLNQTGYSKNWRKLKTLIYCKYNESFIKQGQDAPLSNSNFLLEIRIPGNFDGDFAPHSLELVSINRFLMAYYFRRRSFSSISAEQSCRKGEYYFVKRERHQKAGKRTNGTMTIKGCS